MPRNGSGVYSLPPNTAAVDGQPADAGKFNTLTQDIAGDLNAARPVSAGGTGATAASGARTNLGVPSVTETVSFIENLNATYAASLNDLSPTDDPNYLENQIWGRITGTIPSDGWPGISAGDFIHSMSWGSSAVQIGYNYARTTGQAPIYYREKAANVWGDWVPIHTGAFPQFISQLDSTYVASLNDLSPTSDPNYRENQIWGRIAGTPPTDGWTGMAAGDFIHSMSWGGGGAIQVGYNWQYTSGQSPIYYRQKAANTWDDWVPIQIRNARSWTTVTPDRSLGTNFTNTSGDEMVVKVVLADSTASTYSIIATGYVDGVQRFVSNNSGTTGQRETVTLIVPDQSTYRVEETAGAGAVLERWAELSV